MNYRARQDAALELVQRLRGRGARAEALPADISDETAVGRLFDLRRE